MIWKLEQLGKDLELFSQHAGRKSVTMEDVILSGKLLIFPWNLEIFWSVFIFVTFLEEERSLEQ